MNGKTLLSDLTAGFTTGLFSIPEGMAYAKLMGVNPVYGLYSSMVAPIVASMTTGTILMVSTLTSVIAICTGSVIQQAGIDVASHPPALLTITFLVGAIMFLRGLLPDRHGVKKAAVILTLRQMETLPGTTLKWLIGYNRDLREGSNLLLLAGVGSQVFDLLAHTGIIDAIGKDNIFPSQRVMTASIDEAVARTQVWIEENSDGNTS